MPDLCRILWTCSHDVGADVSVRQGEEGGAPPSYHAIESNLKRAERLRQAILKRAFEGKLVPQDPTDEPASVLLERIRVGRQAHAQFAKMKSKRG